MRSRITVRVLVAVTVLILLALGTGSVINEAQYLSIDELALSQCVVELRSIRIVVSYNDYETVCAS